MKEKLQKFFNCLFIVISILLFGCVCWCAGKFNYDNNNFISAYAVEEEQYINLPFDECLPFNASNTTANNIGFIGSYRFYQNKWMDSWYSASFYSSFQFVYDNINNKYLFTFGEDYLYDTTNNKLFSECFGIYPNKNMNDLYNFTPSSTDIVLFSTLNYITIGNYKYYDIFTSYGTKFILAQCLWRNGVIGTMNPYLFIDSINSNINKSQFITYDTTTMTTITHTDDTTENVLNNVVNYGNNFSVISIQLLSNNVLMPSINGFYNKYPAQSVRTFYLTNGNEYQEGYNSGYDEGYNAGYQNGLNQNAINPFDDWYCKLQLGNSTTHEYVSVGTANEDIMTNHGSTNISEKAQGITWFIENTTSFGSADYWSVSFNAKSRDYDILLSNFGTLVIGTIEDNTFNTILPYNTEVRCSIARNGTSQLLTFILTAGQSSIVDFTNINNVDYSSYYLQNLNLHFTTQDATNYLYYLSINQQNLGNYEDGYSAGYNSAINDTRNNFINGYNQGYVAGQQNGNGEYTFFGLIGALIDAPIVYFSSLFDFEILGTNIKGFLLGLFTLAIIITLVRVSLGKK